MESFVLLVLYHALRYMRHNFTDIELLRQNMEDVFDQARCIHGIWRGGENKRSMFMHQGVLEVIFCWQEIIHY